MSAEDSGRFRCSYAAMLLYLAERHGLSGMAPYQELKSLATHKTDRNDARGLAQWLGATRF
jgi:hypothetical protein